MSETKSAPVSEKSAAIETVINIPAAKMEKGRYRNITGNVATAWGLLAAADKPTADLEPLLEQVETRIDPHARKLVDMTGVEEIALVGGPVLLHVDAYRLGGNAYAPGQNAIERLLDELESLGLDEELEDPSDNTIILMEWGEQMAAALAPERLEIHIDRPLNTVSTDETSRADNELTSNGTRTVTFIPVGASWQTFDITRNNR